jgi:hypothetical protein
MTCYVEFDTENDAFHPDPSIEIATILRKVADHIDLGMKSGKVMDSNGNSVGRWYYEEEYDDGD